MQQPQTTTNDHNQPQTISKRPRTTTNYQPRKPNYQQTTTNDHPCISNRKSDVSFLLPGPGNYKEHTDFETQYGASSKLRGGGLQIVKWGPTKVSSSNKPGGGGS